MVELTPTAELLAAARRIRDTRVEADYQEPPAKDPAIRALHEAGLIRWVQVLPSRRISDYWRLTGDGADWLGRHDDVEVES